MVPCLFELLEFYCSKISDGGYISSFCPTRHTEYFVRLDSEYVIIMNEKP